MKAFVKLLGGFGEYYAEVIGDVVLGDALTAMQDGRLKKAQGNDNVVGYVLRLCLKGCLVVINEKSV